MALMQELQQRIQSVIDKWGLNGNHPSDTNYREEMGKIRKDIVDFHGEMVLLENYSNINYTEGVTAAFLYTDLVSKLVKECESTIDAVFPAVKEEGGVHEREQEAITVVGEGIFRNTVAALLTLQEIRRGSSTYSHFSLPPLILPDPDLIQSIQLQSPIPIV
ncbi:SPX domain-containing protein 3 [Vitis vinifera]|uniref:SPX domain-containing protein 3 n=1 Tax=Vitis vinifera TaxID=29760 RepID=A0A438GXG2_VITVI|nr:SPX domain-containing protein 3 [Vitis vinifera]